MSNADAAIAGADSPRDEVDDLMTRTRARGSLTITTGEIFSALPKLEPETKPGKTITVKPSTKSDKAKGKSA